MWEGGARGGWKKTNGVSMLLERVDSVTSAGEKYTHIALSQYVNDMSSCTTMHGCWIL